jgi:hypothetical protein
MGRPVFYGLQYSVPTEAVEWKPKPSDCDFLHAPIGGKGCHYEKTVRAFNAAGQPIGGDDAITFGRDDKTGKQIVSFDGGKTWDWLPAEANPDVKVTRVVVGWKKVVE